LDNDEEFQKLRRDNSYDYEDRIVISPEKMGAEYDAKVIKLLKRFIFL
jgi:hypothetical protein